MENEYARILCEQGILGLLLWVGFILWFLSGTKRVFAKGSWATSRRLIWGLCVVGLATGVMGTGLLASIPGTAVFLLGMGFVATPMRAEAAARRQMGIAHPILTPAYRPAPIH